VTQYQPYHVCEMFWKLQIECAVVTVFSYSYTGTYSCKSDCGVGTSLHSSVGSHAEVSVLSTWNRAVLSCFSFQSIKLSGSKYAKLLGVWPLYHMSQSEAKISTHLSDRTRLHSIMIIGCYPDFMGKETWFCHSSCQLYCLL